MPTTYTRITLAFFKVIALRAETRGPTAGMSPENL